MRRTIGGLAVLLVTAAPWAGNVFAAPEASAAKAAAPGAQTPSTALAPAAHPAGQIRGTISYGRHAPAVGAVVIVHPEGPAPVVYAATTGETGGFAFDDVPDGTYRAEARREGFTTVVKTGIVVRAPFRAVVELLLAPGQSPPEPPLDLDGTVSVAGHVHVAGGAPLAEARVRVVRPDAASDPRTALTDAAGSFSFDGLRAGRWRFEVIGAGLLPLRADLDVSTGTMVDVALARQPANYQPLAQDLIVPEDVIPPKAP